MEYLSFNKYLKDKFGQKVYKISLDGGFTRPPRAAQTVTERQARKAVFFAPKAEAEILPRVEK